MLVKYSVHATIVDLVIRVIMTKSETYEAPYYKITFSVLSITSVLLSQKFLLSSLF
jgi:hypothetical protein